MPMFKAQDVQKAFKAIRRGIPPGFGKSRKWDIVDPATGDLFPPKAILFLAKQFAGDDSRSGGGGDIGTNNALRECGFRVILKPEFQKSEASEDVQEILDSESDATTKLQLINARLGQGGFRSELIELWEGKCALTQVDVQPVLRASHIKSWRDSNDNERLDPANGFLLVANADALFDRHFISFDEEGRVLVCPTVDQTALEKMGLQAGRNIDFKPQNITYLQWHRRKFEKLRGRDTCSNFLNFALTAEEGGVKSPHLLRTSTLRAIDPRRRCLGRRCHAARTPRQFAHPGLGAERSGH